MANVVKHPEEKNTTSQPAHRTRGGEEFWLKNSKIILYALGAIILLVAGYFIYQTQFKAPNELKAADAMWKAEDYYRKDSARLALNGDGPNPGFLKIMSRYSGTKAANLAKFYAGSSYLKLGDFNNAIKHLKDFETDDKLVMVRATGLLGDAYAETGKKNEAIEMFKIIKDKYHATERGAEIDKYLARLGELE